jgi:transcription antitermination protein NusB
MADANDAQAPAERRPGTRAPHRARERALKILFQADLRGESPLEGLRRVLADPRALEILDDLDVDDPAQVGDGPVQRSSPEPLDGYTKILVEGVSDHRDGLDATIERFARRWRIPRMPAIDRNILRLGTYELMHEDTPAPVVIDEALELAKSLSTDRSGPYINGVLEAIRRSLVDRRRPIDDEADGSSDPAA